MIIQIFVKVSGILEKALVANSSAINIITECFKLYYHGDENDYDDEDYDPREFASYEDYYISLTSGLLFNQHPDIEPLVTKILAANCNAIDWSCANIIRGLWLFRYPELSKEYMMMNSGIIDIAIALFFSEQNVERFSYNSHDKAIDLLEAHQDRIDWFWLSRNKNPRALQLVLDNYNQPEIDWIGVCQRPDAKTFLICHPEK